MKQISLLSLLLIYFLGWSQSNFLNQHTPVSLPNNYNLNAPRTTNKSMTCTDTVYYPFNKMTGAPEADKMYRGTAYIDAVSQAYYFSGNGIIRGIRAYFLLDLDGVPGNMNPVKVSIKVTTIGSQNIPATTIDSSIVYINDVGFNNQNLIFDNPISVNDSFALVVAMEDSTQYTDTVYYVTNTSANNDGQGEKLSCVRAPGFGGWYNAFNGFGGWDMDLLLAPIFEQTFSASFMADTTNICPGDTVSFANTSMINRDRMFNRYQSLGMPLYMWDFKDGNTSNAIDTSHAFLSSGLYDVTLKAYNYGWTVTCVDSSKDFITVQSAPVAQFSFNNNNGTVTFTDASTTTYGAINSWTWTFGDGNSSNLQNPTHTYATNSTYTVCLSVSDELGCFVDDTCQQILINTGLDNYFNPNNFSFYPIPAKKVLKVVVPENVPEGYLDILNIVGEHLKTVKYYYETEVNVSVTDLPGGIYFIKLKNADNETLYTKRFVVEH